MDLAGNNEVTLEEMLDARERRVFLQNSLIQTYNKPIISFTLNIPGPVKVFDKIPETFEEGVRKIRQALCDSAITVYHESEVREKTGYEAFCRRCFPSCPETPDVGAGGTGLRSAAFMILILSGRMDARFQGRKPAGRAEPALICGRPAHECSRSRRHSVEELVMHIEKLLGNTSKVPDNDRMKE